MADEAKKVLVTVTKEELEEMNEYHRTKRSARKVVQLLLEAVVEQEKENQKDIDLWWDKIREKYHIAQEKLCVSHQSGDIMERV